MSRNEEKAQSMLNRLYLMKRALYLKDPDEPPEVISECNTLNECYRWREQVIKKVSDKITEIQNSLLPADKIRGLNDEINTLLTTKRQWDERILELGGPNYLKTEKKFYDNFGFELPGSSGYKYFGAAKDLEGVRELFYTNPPKAPAKTLEQLSNLKLGEKYYKRTNIIDLSEESANLKNKIINKFITNNISKYNIDITKDTNKIIENILEQEYNENYSPNNNNKNIENKAIELEKRKEELIKNYLNKRENNDKDIIKNIILQNIE